MAYRTIVADPPWHYDSRPGRYPDPRGANTRQLTGAKAERLSLPYQTMDVREIMALPVLSLAEQDAHLYLWTTQRYLEHGFAVLRAWGFQMSSVLVWSKGPKGLAGGRAYLCSTEFVLFGRRGRLPPLRTNMGTCFTWPRSIHSAKPEHFYDLVEQVSPGPYVELFARRHRLGWDVWGDQSANTAQLAAW